jgi:hypothetical protein
LLTPPELDAVIERFVDVIVDGDRQPQRARSRGSTSWVNRSDRPASRRETEQFKRPWSA